MPGSLIERNICARILTPIPAQVIRSVKSLGSLVDEEKGVGGFILYVSEVPELTR